MSRPRTLGFSRRPFFSKFLAALAAFLRDLRRRPARLVMAAAAGVAVIAGAIVAGGALIPGPASAPAAAVHHVARHTATAHLTVSQPRAAQPKQHAPAVSHSQPSGLQGWISSADNVLIQHGTPRSAVSSSAALIVVQHESGGNPNASNGWDSNAAAGTPSEGIAQTTAPTFHAYALPGHTNIWNPVDNMVAAFRYAVSRYGSMNKIPGVVAVRGGGSYVGY